MNENNYDRASRRRLSLINVDKSFKIINELKKAQRQRPNLNDKYEATSSLRDENLLNISITQPLSKDAPSPQRDVMKMPQFDNSPSSVEYFNYFKIRDRKPDAREGVKWKEVMRFMKKNPQVMMDLMPPTPGKAGRAIQQTGMQTRHQTGRFETNQKLPPVDGPNAPHILAGSVMMTNAERSTSPPAQL